MHSRLEKSLARRLILLVAPECGEVQSMFRSNRDGWVKMPAEIELLRKNLGIGEIHVASMGTKAASASPMGLCADVSIKHEKRLA